MGRVVGFYTDKKKRVRPITKRKQPRIVKPPTYFDVKKKHEERSKWSRFMDERLQAKIVESDDYQKWMREPGRYDVKGIDTRREELLNPKSGVKMQEEYEFDFEESNDPRKGMPYVARLSLRDGKVEREFYKLPRIWGKKTVLVKGKFRAKEGDVIEMRGSTSWKNDWRSWYQVRDGKLVSLANETSLAEAPNVLKILKEKAEREQL